MPAYTNQYSFVGVSSERAFAYRLFYANYNPRAGHQSEARISEFISAKQIDWLRLKKQNLDRQ
jgi:hypothetical protein